MLYLNEYFNVTVLGVDRKGIRISHDAGISYVNPEMLSANYRMFLKEEICEYENLIKNKTGSNIQRNIPVVNESSSGKKNIRVFASGIGKTSEEALKSALQSAVYQVNGVYMISETKINDEKMTERTHFNTSGAVESYIVLSQQRNVDNDFIVELSAVVTAEKSKPSAIKSGSGTIQTKDVLNELMKHEGYVEFFNSLTMILDDFASNMVIAEALGTPQFVSSNNVTHDEIPLSQRVKIRIDYSNYAMRLSELERLLAVAAVPRRSGLYSSSVMRRFSALKSYLIVFKRNNYLNFPAKWGDLNYSSYKLPVKIFSAIKQYCRSFSYELRIAYKDKSGTLLYEKNKDVTEQLKNGFCGVSRFLACFDVYGKSWFGSGASIFISPFIFSDLSNEWFDSIEFSIPVNMPVELWQKICDGSVSVNIFVKKASIDRYEKKDLRRKKPQVPIRRYYYNPGNNYNTRTRYLYHPVRRNY